MPKRTSITGSELFIVDNSEEDWKVLRYLHDWCQLSKAIDVATGYFEIGALLGLDSEWQKVDQFRILIGGEVSLRTANAFGESLKKIGHRLDASLELEKAKTIFSRVSLRLSKPSTRAKSPAVYTARTNSTPRLTSLTRGRKWWALLA